MNVRLTKVHIWVRPSLTARRDAMATPPPAQQDSELSPEVIHIVFHRLTHSRSEQRPRARKTKSPLPSNLGSQKIAPVESAPPTHVGISDVLRSTRPKNRPVEGICDLILSMATKHTAVSRETLMRPVGGPTNIQPVIDVVMPKINRGAASRCGVLHTVIHSDIHRPMHRLPSFPHCPQRSS